MDVIDVLAQQDLTTEDSPYGAVALVHSGSDLDAWSIWKDFEEVEPSFGVMDREDLLYVERGSLCLEIEGAERRVISAGQLCVIPAGTPFRGYRWPRHGEPCLFLAVAPAGASFKRL